MARIILSATPAYYQRLAPAYPGVTRCAALVAQQRSLLGTSLDSPHHEVRRKPNTQHDSFRTLSVQNFLDQTSALTRGNGEYSLSGALGFRWKKEAGALGF